MAHVETRGLVRSPQQPPSSRAEEQKDNESDKAKGALGTAKVATAWLSGGEEIFEEFKHHSGRHK